MMNALTEFDGNEEERLVRDSIRRMMQDTRRPIVINGEITPPGLHAMKYMTDLEAMGLSELILADGSIDVATVRRIAIICEEAGSQLFLAPTAECLGLPLLEAAGLLKGGASRKPDGLTLAAIGDPFRDRSGDGGIQTAESKGGIRLSGTLRRVPFAPLADSLLVWADEGKSPCLVLVPARGDGVSVAPEAMADGTNRAIVKFENCALPRDCRLIEGADAHAARNLLVDLMLLGASAQLAGIAARVFHLSCEHISTRHQFGRPLAAFQALQHRAANDFVAVEVARAFLYQLCDYWEEESKRRPLLHALLAKTAQTAIDTTKSAIQMHGAMGFTAEHELGWNLKAAVALSTRYGDIATHRRLFAECDIAFW